MNAGRYESFIPLFSRAVGIVQGKKRVEGLFFRETLEKQQASFDSRWSIVRWRLLVRLDGRNSFVIFVRAPKPGGVWRHNVYPVCARDVSFHLYTIASQPNPEWSTLFSSKAEIFEYLKDVVARNKLEDHIRFGTTIMEAKFLKSATCWQLTNQNGCLHVVEDAYSRHRTL